MNYNMSMNDRSPTLLKIRVSEIFPEIAWRMLNYHQATHPCIACFWVPIEELPGGTILIAMRCIRSNPVSGF